MSKYDRMIFILNSLRSRRNLTAGKLAEECQVTERSIYRDILALSEANVPIYYDRGYKLASGNFLPPLNFDFDEYNCLRLALESTPLRQTDKYGELLKKIRAKIDAGLSDTVRNRRRFTPETMSIDIPITSASQYNDVFFGKLENAIMNDLCLEIMYDSLQSGLSHRIVEPYFIVFRNRAFYFVARCQNTNDFRTFRIDRLQEVNLTDKTFVRRSGITVESYFEGSWGVLRGKPVTVKVLFRGIAAKVVSREKHHPGEQVEKLKDGRVRYRVKVRGTDEIRRWILGFGEEAEVIEPDELRMSLQKLGQYLSKSYAP